MEGSPDALFRLADGFPFTIDAAETTRIDELFRFEIPDREDVLSQAGVIDKDLPAAGPVPFETDLVEADIFLGGNAGMVVVKTQGLAGKE